MSEHQVPKDANNGPWATPICGSVAWGADITLVCDGEIVMASYNELRTRARGSEVWAVANGHTVDDVKPVPIPARLPKV